MLLSNRHRNGGLKNEYRKNYRAMKKKTTEKPRNDVATKMNIVSWYIAVTRLSRLRRQGTWLTVQIGKHR